MGAKLPPSPFRGVSAHRTSDPGRFLWIVRIKVDRRSHYLGDFPPGEAEAAARLYDRVAYRVWGEPVRAVLNFPDHGQLSDIIPDGVPRDPRDSPPGEGPVGSGPLPVPNRGSLNPAAKLTEEHVAVIRSMLERGLSHEAIAAKFGVGRRDIGYIARGETWKHVPADPFEGRARGEEGGA